MPVPTLSRLAIQQHYFLPETEVVQQLLFRHGLADGHRQTIAKRAQQWVEQLRRDAAPTLMESFLAEYGLSTNEGVMLMCLAEAFLRVPDNITMDKLIRDKVGSGHWSKHRHHSRSSLVNASTWALMLTGRILGKEEDDDRLVRDQMGSLVKRLGEPVVRQAVTHAMKVLGKQFVCGRSIEEAIQNGKNWRAKDYQFSYDMLGEAAKTAEEAHAYFLAYRQAINAISKTAKSSQVHKNAGISIKLSALHPRYEHTQHQRVMTELVPRLAALVQLACNANIGLNIDAEEADRLDLSLEVIEQVLRNPDLAAWEGFGVVVQAYSKQALPVLEWLRDLAQSLKRKIAIRLVKGAYWDTEIKNAQVLGLAVYPVFTRKSNTDTSYLACARFLLDNTAYIYPQFATHNAHTASAIMALAGDFTGFEFQRLHGMGESLHEIVRQTSGVQCRIYAPVGVHKDLLAYLVRRLLENGANSSFVNQVLNDKVDAAQLVRDPVTVTQQYANQNQIPHPNIALPTQLFGAERPNSRGWNLHNSLHAAQIEQALLPWQHQQWQAAVSHIDADVSAMAETTSVVNPANAQDIVGSVQWATAEQAKASIAMAQAAFTAWNSTPVNERAHLIEQIADLYEAHTPELMALLIREAGKSRLDAILEIREAVDFCRYYAQQAKQHQYQDKGVFVCISPWNFPLAIFTGQIVAALVTGNTVVAKPAEPTNLIAMRAVALMYQAGIPNSVLSLLPGLGSVVGAALVADARIAGVCFTGSMQTALHIDRALAEYTPKAVLIAETGGLNAMIMDSTALPQQAVRDIVAGAFQSAGQRCSALRVLYVQEEVLASTMTMLEGAMQELCLTNPWQANADLGPVISATAKQMIESHCRKFEQHGRLLYRLKLPEALPVGHYVAPTVLRLECFEELEQEIFGPVLHVLTFKAGEVDSIIDTINRSGYRLTLGIHSRIGHRVDRVCGRAEIGNIYVNRNQIGAVVGVQPFGGEALSGTGPKAGGEWYLKRFAIARYEQADEILAEKHHLAGLLPLLPETWQSVANEQLAQVQALSAVAKVLPGPTGERNSLMIYGHGVALCLGNEGNNAQHSMLLFQQVMAALAAGSQVYLVSAAYEWLAPLQQALIVLGHTDVLRVLPKQTTQALSQIAILNRVLLCRTSSSYPVWRQALAAREGARVPLVDLAEGHYRLMTERVVSVDTTATGGNTQLLSLSS